MRTLLLLVSVAACAPGPSDALPALPGYWLPTARIGVPYRAALEGLPIAELKPGLPVGLRLDGEGAIAGTPIEAGHARFLGRPRGGPDPWLRVDLSVLAAQEVAATSARALAAPGPHPVAIWDGAFPARDPDKPSITRALRVHYPCRSRDDSRPTDDLLPLVVFHHGSVPLATGGSPPHQRFGPLLAHWASHGFVVAAVDGLDLLLEEGDLTPDNLQRHLRRMSANQRSALAFLRQNARNPGFPPFRQIDPQRVIVAGHSRGGGASLLSLEADPSLLGAILIKPIDPLLFARSPEPRRLPAKPMLLFVAEHDLDVTFPIADFLYERRSGPLAAVTLLGDVHGFTCGEGCPPDPEEQQRAEITPEQDWAVTNSYAVAFLKYVGNGAVDHAPLIFGSAGLSSDLTPRGVLVRSDRGAAALRIDDFQDADENRNSLGLPSRTEGASRGGEVSWLDEVPSEVAQRFEPRVAALYREPALLAQARVGLLAAASPGARYQTELGGIDVSAREVFVLRLLRMEGRLEAADLGLRFTDGAGRTVTSSGTDHVGARGVGGRFSDVIVPLRTLRLAGLDLSALAAFELRLEAEGTVLIDDLRFE